MNSIDHPNILKLYEFFEEEKRIYFIIAMGNGLDLFDEIGKEQLHFVLHGCELRDLCVGVFIENVFDFAPFHFLTGFVEKRTFLPVLEAIFTDKTRLTALRIHTDHEAGVSINAFGTVFEVFARHQYSVFFYFGPC